MVEGKSVRLVLDERNVKQHQRQIWPHARLCILRKMAACSTPSSCAKAKPTPTRAPFGTASNSAISNTTRGKMVQASGPTAQYHD
jgi:hypothetical protein